MDTKSLIEQIASSRTLTPYEAIKIQYLDRKYRFEQVEKITHWTNTYIDVNNLPTILSPYQLKSITTFESSYKGEEYDCYQWVANNLFEMDVNCGEVAYKGLVLLQELRTLRADCITNMLMKSHRAEPITGTLLEFTGYSYINQKRMTYVELVESFTTILHLFIQIADDILTLNYFLKRLVDEKELKCLEYLKMWFSQVEKSPEEKEEDKFLSTTVDKNHSCYDVLFSLIIDQNHPDYVAFMKHELEAKALRFPHNFKEDSLEYVMNTIKDLSLIHIENLCLEKADWGKLKKEETPLDIG
ncbi:MAG: hypothetical protein WA061_05415 [Microgenomates group bacterium]